jgi:hypothetical protein
VVSKSPKRTNAHLVPGIEAMLPDSPMARLLRDAPVRDGIEMAVIAGDIEGGNLLKRLGVLLTDYLLFDNVDNDLVVDTRPRCSPASRRRRGRGLFDRGADVSHFRYFTNIDTRAALRDWLVRPSRCRWTCFPALAGPFSRYAAALAEASRASRDVESADLPVVVVLPGVMGSHLRPTAATGSGSTRWTSPAAAWPRSPGSSPASRPRAVRHVLRRALQGARASHRVERFRLRLAAAAGRAGRTLAEFLDRLLQRDRPADPPARAQHGRPGGARLHPQAPAGDGRADGARARLVMLGTPNQGAYSMVENLLGKGDTLRSLVRLDVTHDMQEVLADRRRFPRRAAVAAQAGLRRYLPGAARRRRLRQDFQQAPTWIDYQKGKVFDLWFGDGKSATPAQPVLDSAELAVAQDGRDGPALPRPTRRRSSMSSAWRAIRPAASARRRAA